MSETVGTPAPALAEHAWAGHAFGLDLRSEIAVDGLDDCEPLGRASKAALEPATPEEIERAWGAPGEPLRLREWRFEDGGLEGFIDSHPSAGYRLFVEGYGMYLIGTAGERVRVAPPPGDGWRWQRCLLGQVLPMAAVLSGIEVLHASAVAVDGRAIGIVGTSGAGKSSVALRLVARGAALMADDVLALEASELGATGYPGAGVTSIRHEEVAALGGEVPLGEVLGDDGEALRVRIAREPVARPLSALFFLDRRAEVDEVERLAAPDPRLLLGATFNLVVQTPERLRRQLDVCSAVADVVPVFRLGVAAGSGSDATAARLLEALPW